MANEAVPGGVPAAVFPASGSQAYFLPPPHTEKIGPKTWQVIAGFFTATTIICGGLAWVADRVYLTKDTYRQEREADVAIRAELQATVKTNTQTTAALTTAVGELNSKLEILNLTGVNTLTPRHRSGSSPR